MLLDHYFYIHNNYKISLYSKYKINTPSQATGESNSFLVKFTHIADQ